MKTSSDANATSSHTPHARQSQLVDVVIVGAGPYGLSIAAHLRQRGVPFRIFGKPLAFWKDMPEGLFLKSLGFATTIANPEGLTFDAWCRERRLEDFQPCSTDAFTEYGVWLQEKLVPQVEQVDVTSVENAGGHFYLTLATGETVVARKVVVAVGLAYFQRIPEAIAGLPGTLASHTMAHRRYDGFRGKEVCVLGAGQSAIEAAILLHEAGARVQMIARRPPVIHTRTADERSVLSRMNKPMTVLGEGKLNWLLEHLPMGPFFLPDSLRVGLTRRHLGPAGAWWVRERFVGKVAVNAPCEIVSAREEMGQVALCVREQSGEREIRVDHVVAGTGFEVDIDRLPFLATLLPRIERLERAPRLNRHFESSVPGLHFVGVMSALSFGPLFRFICGTYYTAPAIAAYFAKHRTVPNRAAAAWRGARTENVGSA